MSDLSEKLLTLRPLKLDWPSSSGLCSFTASDDHLFLTLSLLISVSLHCSLYTTLEAFTLYPLSMVSQTSERSCSLGGCWSSTEFLRAPTLLYTRSLVCPSLAQPVRLSLTSLLPSDPPFLKSLFILGVAVTHPATYTFGQSESLRLDDPHQNWSI